MWHCQSEADEAGDTDVESNAHYSGRIAVLPFRRDDYDMNPSDPAARESGLQAGIRTLVLLCGFAAQLLAPGVAAGPLPKPVQDADYYFSGAPSPALVELGELLFFDKILSGNRNISCGSCHHTEHATGDGLALSIGEGGYGLGPERTPGEGSSQIRLRVGRNAQQLFNLGAREFTVLFHDGRVELSAESPHRFLTPVGGGLPAGLDNVLAAQALFPLVSPEEMAGQYGENPIADEVARGNIRGAWSLLEDRLRATPDYSELFAAAFTSQPGEARVSLVNAANAIAAFTAVRWRADDSPFDRYLRGDSDAMTEVGLAGMELFYGDAGCSSCHSGVFQTDHGFYSIGMPQVGPGKGHGFDGHEDFGREAVTGNPAERYRFRTPSLRNVTETGPWGHSGAFSSLESVVRHHLEPEVLSPDFSLVRLKPARADLDATDFLVMTDPQRSAGIASSSQAPSRTLDDEEVRHLLEFMISLRDESSLGGHPPENVPSGLPVTDSPPK